MAVSKKILTHPEKCMGCLLCAMRCSLAYKGLFSPLEARLIIQRPVSGCPKITFTDECNTCGLCVRLCPYNALTMERGEN